MNVIGKKWLFIGISGILVLLSVLSISFYGFKLGIDFTGGTLWQIKFDSNVSRDDLSKFFSTTLKIDSTSIVPETSNNSFIIRLPELSEPDHQKNLQAITKQFGKTDELLFESIGASIGGELRSKAITAFILVLVGISLYIAFAFRKVSRPISSWKYGIITLLTLFHDAIIPAGLFSYLGYKMGVEVDTNFIVAILVVMGFSVHDTIVVFDRIRENLRRIGAKEVNFDTLVNDSVNQTFVRSINTSLTLILVLVALYFLGAVSLKYFVLTMLVGTVVGTYSSIFIASPFLTIWRKKEN